MADQKREPTPTGGAPVAGGDLNKKPPDNAVASDGGGGIDKAAWAAPANAYKELSFEIEFGTKQNNNISCPITRRKYRGRWDNSNVKARVPDDHFTTCPVIPGHRLRFDGASRTVTIHDPLATKEFRETLKELKATIKLQFPGLEGDPDEPVEYAKLSDDKLKQWCYWARRWVDQGSAQRVSGAVPDMDRVTELPGRVECNTYDNSARREKFPAEVPQYVPPGKTQKV